MPVITRVRESERADTTRFTGVDEVIRAMAQSAGGFPRGRSRPTSAPVARLTRGERGRGLLRQMRPGRCHGDRGSSRSAG